MMVEREAQKQAAARSSRSCLCLFGSETRDRPVGIEGGKTCRRHVEDISESAKADGLRCRTTSSRAEPSTSLKPFEDVAPAVEEAEVPEEPTTWASKPAEATLSPLFSSCNTAIHNIYIHIELIISYHIILYYIMLYYIILYDVIFMMLYRLLDC